MGTDEVMFLKMGSFGVYPPSLQLCSLFTDNLMELTKLA